jgi:hypothetical protein
MKNLCLALGLVALMFSLGCGSSSSSGPVPMGNFSNSSMSGQYAYQLQGFDLNTGNPYTRAGVFTANGAGVITSGTDDFTEGALATSAISGTYSISNDGTGSLVLTFPTGTVQWAVTLQSSSKVYMIETSSTPTGGTTPFTGYGVAELQDSAAFAGPPSGTFVFRSHSDVIGNTSITPSGSVGALTISGGTITGAEDVNTIGVGLTSPLINSGSVSVPDGTGRGTGSFTDSNLTTTSFVYYVVDSSNIRFLNSTFGSVGLGRGQLQTGPFTAASLSGSYAFGSRGDTLNNLCGVHTVGVFTADGVGAITPFTFDAQRDGVLTSNGSLTSNSFTVAANGRTVVTLNSNAATQIYWLINGTRAFFLVSDPNSAAEGTADLQTASSFSNSTISGQFAFLNDGVTLAGNPPTIANTLDRVATLQWNGSGGLILNEFINLSGSNNTPGFLSGSYSVSSNGRATGKINSTGNNINFAFYLISGSQAYVLQTDPNAEVDGTTQLQQ